MPERRAALDQLVLHATTLRIPVVEMEGGSLTSLSGFDGHQGVALVVEPRRWSSMEEVLGAAAAAGEPAFLLVLDHLEDPQNVGTLLRSAEACGVHGVFFPERGSAPISPAAVKASAGAVEHLRLVPVPDLAATLVDLHGRGVRVVGADGSASLTIGEADLRGPLAIVVGSEGRGIGTKVRRRIDVLARIPMRGRVASLNASVAGSVFLFEALGQRQGAAPPPTAGSPAAATDVGPATATPTEPSTPTAEGPAPELEPMSTGEATAAPEPAPPADTDPAPPSDDEALLPEPGRDP